MCLYYSCRQDPLLVDFLDIMLLYSNALDNYLMHGEAILIVLEQCLIKGKVTVATLFERLRK
jgi:hypothetical protein